MSLKLTWVPEKDAVKWETPDEYGFDPIPEVIASLAQSDAAGTPLKKG
jgi:hypothetical protein